MSPNFRNAAVGRRVTEPLRPPNPTCDVAHDVLPVPSGVQTGLYLSHDLACAPQAVCPGGHPNSANAQTCESFASKSGASMSSMRAPADYRIQKMRAAEESSRQMNAYVKVRTTAMSRVHSESRSAPRTHPFPLENADNRVPSPITPRRARTHKACNVRDLNAQWENNTDKMIAKNQFKKRCARVPPTRLCTARPERLDPILSYPARARKTLTDDGRVSFRARNQVRGSEGARRGDSGRAPREAGVHALRGGKSSAG